jgi:hypothetical protein
MLITTQDWERLPRKVVRSLFYSYLQFKLRTEILITSIKHILKYPGAAYFNFRAWSVLERLGWTLILVISLIISGIILQKMFANWTDNPGNHFFGLVAFLRYLTFNLTESKIYF